MTDTQQLAQLCEAIVRDPISLQKISDRVYELLQEEIRNQRDRAGDARGRRP